MNTYHYIDRDVTQNRGPRIGASDIPALIPSPDRPNESLAGYGRTAITIWEEKTGRRKREPAGLAAEMGHYLEPKATELFMREVFGHEYAAEWFATRMQYETLKASPSGGDIKAQAYQRPPLLHSIEWYDDQFIVHPDGLYVPGDQPPDMLEVVGHGLQINMTKPFIVEAKSARYWAARRKEESSVSGYDLELRTWQGIPLKHYVQIQFQLAMFGVDVAYLPLLFDTSQFQTWEIRADAGVQGKIVDIAGRLAWHIKHDQPPKEMAINTSDIVRLYPGIDTDFVYLGGGEEEAVIEACRQYRKASAQEKVWKDKKQEAQDTLAVHLKDRGELRSHEGGVLARWSIRKGSERVAGVKDIKSKDPNAYKYLKRKNLLTTTSDSRTAAVVYKDQE